MASQVVGDCVGHGGVCVCMEWGMVAHVFPGVAAMLSEFEFRASVFLTQLSPDILFHCDCWMEISWMLVYGERNLKSQSTIPKGIYYLVVFLFLFVFLRGSGNLLVRSRLGLKVLTFPYFSYHLGNLKAKYLGNCYDFPSSDIHTCTALARPCACSQSLKGTDTPK